MHPSILTRIAAAIAAACTTFLLVVAVVSLSEPPPHDAAPRVSAAPAPAVMK
jgi:hypothetical protein